MKTQLTPSLTICDQYTGINLGGTLRLGAYDCLLKENTKAFEAISRLSLKSAIAIDMNLIINIWIEFKMPA